MCLLTLPPQDCYFPLDTGDGDYRTLSVEDYRVLQREIRTMVIVIEELTAYELAPGRISKEMPLEAGLRQLRSHPEMQGFLIYNGTHSFLEVAWSLLNKKEVPQGIERDMVLRLLRGRGSSHIAFW